MKVRVEFKLSMPGRASWNGRWSGEDRNYTIVRSMSRTAAEALVGEKNHATWSHRWSDGWLAVVEARIVRAGERLKKSDGFSGYDWMVANIIAHGSTCAPGQVPA